MEGAIASIKNFKILSTVFPICMATDLKKIWVICCYLSNFLPPLLVGIKIGLDNPCITSCSVLHYSILAGTR